jgi:hypothetical protein
MRICPYTPENAALVSDKASILTAATSTPVATTEYEVYSCPSRPPRPHAYKFMQIWRRWEDCLLFQDTLEAGEHLDLLLSHMVC